MYLQDRHRSEARRVLGELVRRTRQHRGLTQERLGEWAGLHQSVISRLECGRPIGLRLVTVLRLFDALGIVRLDARLAAWHPWSTEPDLGDDGDDASHSSDVHIRREVDRREGHGNDGDHSSDVHTRREVDRREGHGNDGDHSSDMHMRRQADCRAGGAGRLNRRRSA